MSARRPFITQSQSDAAGRDAIVRTAADLAPLAFGQTLVQQVSTGFRAIHNMGAPFFCVEAYGATEAEARAAMQARVAGFSRPADDSLIHPGSFSLAELRREFDDDTAAEWIGV